MIINTQYGCYSVSPPPLWPFLMWWELPLDLWRPAAGKVCHFHCFISPRLGRSPLQSSTSSASFIWPFHILNHPLTCLQYLLSWQDKMTRTASICKDLSPSCVSKKIKRMQHGLEWGNKVNLGAQSLPRNSLFCIRFGNMSQQCATTHFLDTYICVCCWYLKVACCADGQGLVWRPRQACFGWVLVARQQKLFARVPC